MNHNHPTPPPAPQPLCAVIEPLLPLLSQGRLDAEETRSTREHVATCAWCQRQLRDYDRLRDALRRLEAFDDLGLSGYRALTRDEILQAPDQAPSAPLTPLPPPRAQPPLRRPAGRLTSLAAVAAVLLVTLLAGAIFLQFGRTSGGPHPTPTPT